MQSGKWKITYEVVEDTWILQIRLRRYKITVLNSHPHWSLCISLTKRIDHYYWPSSWTGSHVHDSVSSQHKFGSLHIVHVCFEQLCVAIMYFTVFLLHLCLFLFQTSNWNNKSSRWDFWRNTIQEKKLIPAMPSCSEWLNIKMVQYLRNTLKNKLLMEPKKFHLRIPDDGYFLNVGW